MWVKILNVRNLIEYIKHEAANYAYTYASKLSTEGGNTRRHQVI